MKANVYFANGHISVLSASVAASIAEDTYKNILIIEKPRNLFSDEYFSVNRIFLALYNWDKVIEIDCDYNFHGLRSPLNYMRSYIGRNSKQKEIRNQLVDFDVVNVYATSPSQLWPSMTECLDDLTVIEHGAAEYNLLHMCQVQEKNTLERIYRILRYKLMGDPAMNIYVVRNFLLLDGLKSNVTKNFSLDSDLNLMSYDASEIIQRYVGEFWALFSDVFNSEYQELLELKEELRKYENVYLYLPTSWVNDAEYQDYLNAQLQSINIKNTAFVVKAHPSDRGGYDYLKFSGCDVYPIKSKIQSAIPPEFLLVMLRNPVLLGSYSTSFLYADWWLNLKTSLSVVESSPVTGALIKEYGAVVSDFDVRESLTQ